MNTCTTSTANSVSAISTTDIFACHNAYIPYVEEFTWIILFWIIILIISIVPDICYAPRKGKRELIRDDDFDICNCTILDLTHLKECLRLSELTISDLKSDIQSYEKKAMAIIFGALPLIGFIATKDWCEKQFIVSVLGVINIVIYALSATGAASVLFFPHIGYNSVSPCYTVGYYIRNTMGTHLCKIILEENRKVIAALHKAVKIKQIKLTIAKWFMVVGFIITFAWVSIKALPIVLPVFL